MVRKRQGLPVNQRSEPGTTGRPKSVTGQGASAQDPSGLYLTDLQPAATTIQDEPSSLLLCSASHPSIPKNSMRPVPKDLPAQERLPSLQTKIVQNLNPRLFGQLQDSFGSSSYQGSSIINQTQVTEVWVASQPSPIKANGGKDPALASSIPTFHPTRKSVLSVKDSKAQTLALSVADAKNESSIYFLQCVLFDQSINFSKLETMTLISFEPQSTQHENKL
ncbi:Atpase Wrnip1 [Manis pentadactyla]|nr:Atpase Wrnip1 [Manis pentadactyla]